MPRDDLVAIGSLGGAFAHYAVRSLLLDERVSWSETRYWMLISAFTRHDSRAVRAFLDDWKAHDTRPARPVSKFVPGTHYYALGEKFDTEEEAIQHLHDRGYRYSGLELRRIP